MRGCNTASEMADKTVFNADKHVWTFEDFRNKRNAFIQHKAQWAYAVEQLKLEEPGTQGYDNMVMQRDASRQMMYRIATDYNTYSDIWYKDFWRGDGLPKYLEVD